MQLALLGGGRMGEALLSGLLDAGWDADALAVAEVDPERRRLVEERFRGVRAVPSPAWAVAESDVVVLAVKPSDVGAALEQCLPSLKTDAMVLSIAAGVTLATLEEAVPDRPVVRAMPNTAALVRKGAAAIAGGRHATEAHLDEAERILGSVGVVVRVPEELLDAVTGLSGSGPAYVFLVAEALIDAGTRFDRNLKAGFCEHGHNHGGQRDPPLSRKYLFWNSNYHVRGPLRLRLCHRLQEDGIVLGVRR